MKIRSKGYRYEHLRIPKRIGIVTFAMRVFIVVLAVVSVGCTTVVLKSGSNKRKTQGFRATAASAPRTFDVKIKYTSPGKKLLQRTLHVTAHLPDVDGPYPAVILNHGSPRSAESRKRRAKYPSATKWFLSRGVAVVIPNRRGYGGSDGPYSEGFGTCERPNYFKAGNATAHDIRLVLDWMDSRAWVKKGKVLVAGASAGGWGAIAVASTRHSAVAGVINFAGGRGSPRDGFNCGPNELVQASAQFGKTTTVPSLWIYSVDDPYFPPNLTKRMYRAFRATSAAPTAFVLLGKEHAAGHSLLSSGRGPKLWGKHVDEFLRRTLRRKKRSSTLLMR